MSNGLTFNIQPGGTMKGEARVATDKSISHRSIILGSIAEGITEVTGFLEAEDTLATLRAFRKMGVQIDEHGAGALSIHGVGMHGLQAPVEPLDLGNSGTSMRLLSGLLSAQNFDCELTGDESLSKRPMGRVTEPLAQMGALIESSVDGTAPLVVHGSPELHGIDYAMPVASAQIKSALLLAGLYAQGTTTIIEPAPTRDHTERMLNGFGYQYEKIGNQVIIQGGSIVLKATTIDVPCDISSAAFFMVGAAITEGSDVLLLHIGINPTRTGIINILRLMGADITLEKHRQVGGEPVADVRIRYAPLKGIEIPQSLVPLAIDEFPAIFIAAACAQGVTVLTGAEELRVKESDRIQVMADGLQELGIDAEPSADGMRIVGGQLQGGNIKSHGDHRIAMSFSIAGLRAEAPISIEQCDNVQTSFPAFVDIAKQLGLNITSSRD